MQNQRIKNFWIQVINDLKLYKGVAPNLITENEGNATDDLWQEKLNQRRTWVEIRNYALTICEDIFQKATMNNDAWVGGMDGLFNYLRGNNINAQVLTDYWNGAVFWTLGDNERLLIETETHLGVDNLNDLTTEPEYTMPISLERTLFWLREFDKIMTKNIDIFDTDIVTGRPLSIDEDKVDNFIEAKDTIDNISGHLGGIDLNTLATALNNEGKTLRDAFQEIGQLNQAVKTVLGVNVLPTDYPNQLNLLKTNSDHYNRIHTKLGGKVSDTELDTLLNTPPPK